MSSGRVNGRKSMDVRIIRSMCTGLVFGGLAASASAQTLEMQTGVGGPAGNGPTVAAQVVTMRHNSNNPTGNTFAARTPAITVTYTLFNQQYTGLTPAQGFPASTGGAAVMFGSTLNTGINPAAVAVYGPMNAFGAPNNAMFTSNGNSTTGTGVDVAANGSVAVFISTRALAAQPIGTQPATTARVRLADLRLTFSEPVAHPIIHFSGLGGFASAVGLPPLGFTAEFDLITPALTLTELSGNAAMSAGGTSVNSAAISPNASCANADEAACGSARVNGTGITEIVFRVFINGDGNGPSWNARPDWHSGEVFKIGVSLNPIADLAVTKTNTPGVNGDADQTGDTAVRGATRTYLLRVTNHGPDPVAGARVTDTPLSGIACPGTNTVTVVQPSGTTYSTVGALTGAGITLGLLGSGQNAALSFDCVVN